MILTKQKKYKDEPIIGLYDQNKQLLVQQAGAKASKSWLSSVFSDSDTLDATQIPPQAHQPAPIYTSQDYPSHSKFKRINTDTYSELATCNKARKTSFYDLAGGTE